MFFEVRVYKPNGKLKKTVSRTELNHQYWEKYRQTESEISLNNPGTKPIPAWVKHKLDLEFPSNMELDHQRF